MLSSPPAAAASLASRRAAHRRGAGAPTPASSRIRGPAIVRGPERQSRAPATRSELLDWRSYGAVDGRRARGASDLGGAGVSGRSAPADAAEAAAYHRRSRGIISRRGAGGTTTRPTMSSTRTGVSLAPRRASEKEPSSRSKKEPSKEVAARVARFSSARPR